MGIAFIDNFNSNACPQGGEHDELGSVLMYRTRRGEIRYISESKYYLDNTYFPKPIHRRMRITGGSVACSKCGTPFIESHNPNFYE